MWKEYKEYLQHNPEGYWFKAKLYGWGWTPVKWQGWTAILVYVLAIVAFALTLNNDSTPREIAFTFVLPVAILTAALIRLCYKTGEKPRWQWGPPEKR